LIFLGLEQQAPLFALDVTSHHQQRLERFSR